MQIVDQSYTTHTYESNINKWLCQMRIIQKKKTKDKRQKCGWKKIEEGKKKYQWYSAIDADYPNLKVIIIIDVKLVEPVFFIYFILSDKKQQQ